MKFYTVITNCFKTAGCGSKTATANEIPVEEEKKRKTVIGYKKMTRQQILQCRQEHGCYHEQEWN
jgi:hypothetical protein